MEITVIGLGKLGLPSAACLAEAGHNVLGYDTDLDHVVCICGSIDGRCECPVREPGLDRLLKKVCLPESENCKLLFTEDISGAVEHGDLFFIIVPTPSTAAHRFDNSYIIEALKSMIPHLKKKVEAGKNFIINIVSTVMPESCEGVFIPLLEAELGEVNDTFGLVYNPEFIALGDVISGFKYPDFVLIGESDKHAGDVVEDVYRSMDDQSTAHRMNLISAEIAKLSLNYYVTTKISFANWLASCVVSKFEGADVDAITRAIGADKRIGHEYLMAGAPFGGPCFPRDVRAMATIAPPMNQAESNRSVLNFIKDQVEGDVAIFGMAYKPSTHVTEESASMQLARDIKGMTGHLRWFDPLTRPSDLHFIHRSDQDVFGGECYYEDPYEAVRGATTVVIMTPDIYWEQLDWKRAVDSMRSEGGKLVKIVDPWRLLRRTNWDAIEKDGPFIYIPMGLDAEGR